MLSYPSLQLSQNIQNISTWKTLITQRKHSKLAQHNSFIVEQSNNEHRLNLVYLDILKWIIRE